MRDQMKEQMTDQEEMNERHSSSKEWMDEIPELGQRQDSTAAQMEDLMKVANRLGMYDAADTISTMTEQAA